jgi:hypothetical protein
MCTAFHFGIYVTPKFTGRTAVDRYGIQNCHTPKKYNIFLNIFCISFTLFHDSLLQITAYSNIFNPVSIEKSISHKLNSF